MMIELFDSSEHFELMRSWYDARHELAPEKWRLPRLGFVCDGVAMIWLYQTDSRVGFVDLLVTDPDASMLKRGRALRKFMQKIPSIAKSLGILYLEGFTRTPSLLSMYIKDGRFQHMRGFLVQGAI